MERAPPIDVTLAAAAAGIAGAIAPFAPGPVALFSACVVASSIVAARGRVPRSILVVASIAALVAGVRSIGAVRENEAASAEAIATLRRPSECELEGVVSSMPVDRGGLAADVAIERLGCAEAPLRALARPIRARIHALPRDAARGDRVRLFARLAPAPRTRNPDLGDARPALARRAYVLSGVALVEERRTHGFDLASTIDHARAALRRGLSRVLSAEILPVARALVLGEEDLAPDDDDAFRKSGLTHLLAVSGSHVALVVLGLVAVMRAVLLRISSLAARFDVARIASAAGIPLAIVYEQLAGDAGSARRATATAIVVLLVRALGRRTDVSRALGVSVLATLVIDPLAPFDLSFALSLASTVGLVALAGPFDRRVAAWLPRLPRFVRAPVTTTISATLACAPFVATIASSLPTWGVPANVIAVPIGELAALPLANAAALLGALGGVAASLGALVGSAAEGALRLLRSVARIAASAGSGAIALPPPTAIELAVLVGSGAIAYVGAHRGRALVAVIALGLASLLLAERLAIDRGRPHGVLRVTVLDVGQGDAILVDLPDGSLVMIDAGGEVGSTWDPGQAVVARALAARRRRRVDVAILSHPHPDHFLGLPAALHDVEVGALWDTGQGEAEQPSGRYAELLATMRARGVPIVRPSALCDRPREFGGATIEILAPCPGFDPDRPPNDNSFVVRITYGARRALLVGDSERAAENALLAEHRDQLSADFLKVGHHGSRTSSSAAFLAAVSPAAAAISCGVRNRFGHPHDATLAALVDSHVEVARTDVDGAIAWTTDGRSWSLATARSGW